MRAPAKLEQARSKLEVPPTKDGWRYHLVEDDDPLCKEYIKKLDDIDTIKRISLPAFTKRKVISSSVRLSENDKAPQLRLSDDQMRVTGEKGYSMARATHGTNRGKWYFETRVDSMPPGTALRIGWGQRYANLQAPLGYDEFGYAWRSRFGTKFHQARGKSFDKTGGFGEGDFIGCMIDMPYGNPGCFTQKHHLPQSIKDAGQLLTAKKNVSGGLRVLEEKEVAPPKTKLTSLLGSKISFYKNGRLIGTAYEHIYAGTYYPTISLYKSCVASVNFGPTFKFPPDEVSNDPQNIYLDYRDCQQLPDIEVIDHLLSDLFYLIDNEDACEEKIKTCTENSRTSKN